MHAWLWLIPELGMLPELAQGWDSIPGATARAQHQPGAAWPWSCPFPTFRSCFAPALSQFHVLSRHPTGAAPGSQSVVQGQRLELSSWICFGVLFSMKGLC